MSDFMTDFIERRRKELLEQAKNSQKGSFASSSGKNSNIDLPGFGSRQIANPSENHLNALAGNNGTRRVGTVELEKKRLENEAKREQAEYFDPKNVAIRGSFQVDNPVVRYMDYLRNNKATVKLEQMKVQEQKAQKAEDAKKLSEWSKDHDFLASVASVGTSLVSGADYLARLAEKAALGYTLEYAELTPTEATQAMRSGVVSDKGEVGKFLYNTAMSGVDSLVASLAGGGGAVLLGLGAASNTYDDIKARGGSEEQALVGGAVAGAFESLFEKISIGQFNALKEMPVDGAKTFLRNVFNSSLVNFSEEAATELANIVYDYIAMGEMSNYAYAVEDYTKQYMEQGMSEEEARKKAATSAAWSMAGQVGLAGLSGALMGTGFATIGSGASKVNAALTGKAYDTAGVQYQLVESALEKDPSTNTYQMAKNLEEKLKKGERVSYGEYGLLQQTMDFEAEKAAEKAAKEERKNKIKTTVADVFKPANAKEKAEVKTVDTSVIDVVAPTTEVQKVEAVQEANPDVTIVPDSVTLFQENGDDSATAVLKADILAKLMSGDTTLSNTQLRKLDMKSASTRAVIKAVTGMEVPNTNATKDLLAFAKSIAEQSARSNEMQTAVQEKIDAVAAMAAERAQQAEAAAAETPVAEAPVQPVAEAPVQPTASEQTAQVSNEAEEQASVTLSDGTTVTKAEFIEKYKAANPGKNAEAKYADAVRSNTLGMAYPASTLQNPKAAKSEVKRSVKPAETTTETTTETTAKTAAETKSSESETKATKEQEWTINRINRVLSGIKGSPTVRLGFDMYDNTPGHYDEETHTIYLNGNTLNTRDMLMYTLGHEMVHSVNGGQRDKMVNDILAFIEKTSGAKNLQAEIDSTRQTYIDFYVKQLGYSTAVAESKVDLKYVREEVAANSMSKLLSNSGGLERLANENKPLLDKAIDLTEKFVRGLADDNRAEVKAIRNEAEFLVDRMYRTQGIVYNKNEEDPAHFISRLKSPNKATSENDHAEASSNDILTQPSDEVKRIEDASSISESVDGDTTVATSQSGEPVAMTQGNGSGRFSISTYEEDGRSYLSNWLEKKVKSGDVTRAEADDIVTQMDEYYDLCKTFEDKYAPFGAWSKAKVVKDANGNPAFSVIKANGDYAMNLDFSLVCKKRRTLDAVFGEMIQRGLMDDLLLEEADIAKINDIIRENGFETACALCFVDSKRYRQGKVADAFVTQYNDMVNLLIPDGSDIKADHFDFVGTGLYSGNETALHTVPTNVLNTDALKKVMSENGKQTVPHKIAKHLLNNPSDRKLLTRGEFMNTDGFEAVKVKNPAVMKLYNSSKGSGGPKAAFSDVQYLGDILKKNTFTADKAYKVGGVRIQSFSDYVPRLVFDYIQMMADLAAKKLPAHAYTKEAAFAKQFGMTGVKINLSLVPAVVEGGVAPGLDANGDYAWFDGQSFGSDVNVKGSGKTGFDLAVEIQNAEGYSKNCGTIAVGISNEQIEKMLDDPDIRMIIPYHKSSLNHIVAVMNNIDQYKDYTGVQNTRSKSTGSKIEGKDFNFNEALIRTGDAKTAADEYKAWCEENDYIPKFDDFAKHENYYKLLEDFSTYDNGKATPQGAVTMTFPKVVDAFGSMAQLIEEGLEEDAELEGRREQDVPGIVDQIEKALKVGKDIRYSVDNDYLAAVQSGDMETAQRMVDEAAKAAGYTAAVFHGTDKEFTKFKHGELGIHVGTRGQAEARNDKRVISLYANLGDSFDIYRDYGDWHGKNTAAMMLETEEVEELARYDDTKYAEIERKLRDIAEMPDDENTDTVLREYLQSLGWDSITYENRFEDAGESWEDENWSHIVFDPEGVKSADPVTYDDSGNVIPLSQRFNAENEDIRFSVDRDSTYAPTFYSQMERVVEGVKQDKLGASSVVSMLKGKGVKDEEIKWSGITEFLEGKKSVTKQDLLEFIGSNQLDMEEVVLDGNTDMMSPETGEIFTSMDEFVSVSMSYAEHLGYDPDEVLFDDHGDDHWESYIHDYETGEDIELYKAVRNEESRNETKWEHYKLEGGENYREYLFKLPGSEYTNQSMEAHWGDHKGVLAHARVQDFTVGADLVMFVEEIQSDWHNEGHKKGYADSRLEDASLEYEEISRKPNPTPEETARLVELGKILHPARTEVNQRTKLLADLLRTSEEYRSILDKIVPKIVESNKQFGVDINAETAIDYAVNAILTSDGRRDLARRYDAKFTDEERARLSVVYGTIQELNTQRTRAVYEDGQLRNRPPEAPYSKNYHEFVLKNLLRKAAEAGYDYLAWTPGWMQEERWSSKFAEGYRIEYDQDIPKFLNKYAKQWGSKVAKIPIHDDYDKGYVAERIQNLELDMEEWMDETVYDQDSEFVQSQIQYIRDEIKSLQEADLVWAIPITDAMRKSVMFEGQPRYSVDKGNKTKTGGNTGNVNPDTGYERGSVADSFMRIWNTGDREAALNLIEQTVSRLTEIEAEQAEKRRTETLSNTFRPAGRLPEDTIAKNKAVIEELIAKYGLMPQTSAAQKEVRLPQKRDDKTRVRGFVQTAAAVNETSEAMLNEFEQAIVSGDAGATYVPIGDQATMKRVTEEIEKVGFEKALTNWEHLFESGKAISKDEIAMAEQLYIAACNSNDIPTATKLANQIAVAGTQAGQTVQALTLLKKMTPAGNLYYIQKAVDRLNKDQKGKHKDIVINEELAKKLLEADTQKEIQDALDAICQDLANQMPVTLADKWNTWRYLAMLGNPRTHIRNLVGNAVFMPARMAKDMLGATMERALPQEQRTKAFTVSEELRSFAKQDADSMKDVLTGGGKYNPADMIRDKRRIFKSGALNWAEQFNAAWLEKEDWLFLKDAYSRALGGFLSARGVNVSTVSGANSTREGRAILEEARAYAVKEAQKATYRDMSKFASWLNHLKKNHGPAAEILVDGIIPFTKTPINIVKRGIEYSPAGLVKGLVDLRKSVKNGVSAAEAIDELCAGLTGTAIIGIGAMLTHLGMLVGGHDDDDEDNFEELQGVQEYSLRIGDATFTVDWTAPVALPLFVGSEIYSVLAEGVDDSSDVMDAFMDGLTTMLEPMLSLSMLDGLNKALSSNKYGEDDDAVYNLLATAASSYFAQGVPTLFGQIARTIDDSRRASFTQKGAGKIESWLSRAFQTNVAGKIPFLSEGRMLYIDSWGRADTESSFWARAVENFILPGYVDQVKTTALESELQRLADSVNDTKVFPDRAKNYFSVDGEDYAMTQEEYEAHLIDRGQRSYKLANDIANDAMYKELDDETRAAAISLAYDYAASVAKLNTNEDYAAKEWVKKLYELEKNGYDVTAYLMLRAESEVNETSVTESALGSKYLSEQELLDIVVIDTTMPDSFADPYTSKHEYKLTDEQQEQYKKFYRDFLAEEYAYLLEDDEYQSASVSEKYDLLKKIKEEVGVMTRKEMSDWLWDLGIEPTPKG